MIRIDQPLAVGNKRIRRLQHLVRDRAALGSRKRIRPPSGVIADPEQLRRGHLPIDRPRPRLLRETILMIKRTGTAMFNQVRQRGQRAEINDVVIDNLKDAIDFIDPIDDRQVRIIDRQRIADERLEKMMMRIDQPGINKLPRRVDRFRALRGKTGSDFGDKPVPNQNIAAAVNPIRRITAYNRFSVLQQDCLLHNKRLLFSPDRLFQMALFYNL